MIRMYFPLRLLVLLHPNCPQSRLSQLPIPAEERTRANLFSSGGLSPWHVVSLLKTIPQFCTPLLRNPFASWEACPERTGSLREDNHTPSALSRPGCSSLCSLNVSSACLTSSQGLSWFQVVGMQGHTPPSSKWTLLSPRTACPLQEAICCDFQGPKHPFQRPHSCLQDYSQHSLQCDRAHNLFCWNKDNNKTSWTSSRTSPLIQSTGTWTHLAPEFNPG